MCVRCHVHLLFTPLQVCDGSVIDVAPLNQSMCPLGLACTYFTSTPNNNITSFDDFAGALVTIFYSITLEVCMRPK